MLPLHGREVVEAAVLASEAHGPRPWGLGWPSSSESVPLATRMET